MNTISPLEIETSSAAWQAKCDVVEHLEQSLADPARDDAAISYARSLHLDATEEFAGAEYRALNSLAVNRYFVPAHLGGGLRDLDEMVLVMRSVFRRDPAVALGYGMTSFMAALPVWHSGSEAVQQRLAAILLEGEPVSVAFHEKTHGNDVLANEFRAKPQSDSYSLSGEKWLINNIARAGGATLFARTGETNPARDHSLFFIDSSDLAKGEFLQRIRTLGARTCQLSGWRAEACEVPSSALVGAEGQAFEIVSKAFQITRTVLPGMAIGIADTALRLCYDFLDKRKLYGKKAIELPLVRRDAADAFVDILHMDCVALAVSRMAQVMPEQLSLASSAIKYWVPATMTKDMNAISVLLGARHYLRQGEYAYFQKLMRDLPIVSIGHASSGVCLSLVIQQLRQLAQFGLAQCRTLDFPEMLAADVDAKLRTVFNLLEPLPALNLSKLTLSNRGRDYVLQGLRPILAQIDTAGIQADRKARIVSLGCQLSEAYFALLEHVAVSLAETKTTMPAWYDAAARYCELYAAACAIYMWHYNPMPEAAGIDAQFRQGEWVIRILEKTLGIPSRDAAWSESAMSAMSSRYNQRKSFGLLQLTYAAS